MLENDRELFRVDARRRLLVLGGFTGLLMSAVGARLFHLQVLKGGLYRDLAEDNRISLQPVPAPRGRILDRDGHVLVENNPDYRLAVIPELCGELRNTLERLREVVEITDADIAAVIKQTRRQRSFLPVKVRGHLSWEELSRIEARIDAFPGSIIQVHATRNYPHGILAGHILGYLGEIAESDIQQFSAVQFRSGDLVGKNGVERLFEENLRGVEGVRQMEVNAFGREVRELDHTPPVAGRDLLLTIDTDLQREAEEALGDKAGAVVVLDPRNGEVLVMASRPAFDPNQFIRGLSSQQWQLLSRHPDRPLTNKAIQGHYPPGSTFKIVTALAGFAEGRVSPQQAVLCTGYIEKDGHRYHCWKKGGHGTVDFHQAFAQSCDVYFYRIAERVGIDAIERTARKLGLGQTTQISLEGERGGLIPSRAWKKKVHRMPWFPGETYHSAIGQGYVLCTPLQLACMTAAVANNGVLCRPTLVRHPEGEEPEILRHGNWNPAHIALVRAAMEEVVNGPRGTARQAAPTSVRAAGKTGTAQVVHQKREESGKVIQSDDIRFQDHALYVSYAPADHPELAIAVVVEHGGHGGHTAAPVAKRIIDRFFARRGGVLPEVETIVTPEALEPED